MHFNFKNLDSVSIMDSLILFGSLFHSPLLFFQCLSPTGETLTKKTLSVYVGMKILISD